MKSTRSVSALLAILVCASAAADEISWAKDFASAKAKAKATGRLVMVDFYTD